MQEDILIELIIHELKKDTYAARKSIKIFTIIRNNLKNNFSMK